jgi:hypothetical protein
LPPEKLAFRPGQVEPRASEDDHWAVVIRGDVEPRLVVNSKKWDAGTKQRVLFRKLRLFGSQIENRFLVGGAWLPYPLRQLDAVVGAQATGSLKAHLERADTHFV